MRCASCDADFNPKNHPGPVLLGEESQGRLASRALGEARHDRDDPSALRACPYCGALALRTLEESRGTGVLDETLSVCSACGQSIVSPRWTAGSTRRGLLLVLRKVGPYLLIAAAAWVLKPFLPYLPRRTFGRPGGAGGT